MAVPTTEPVTRTVREAFRSRRKTVPWPPGWPTRKETKRPSAEMSGSCLLPARGRPESFRALTRLRVPAMRSRTMISRVVTPVRLWASLAKATRRPSADSAGCASQHLAGGTKTGGCLGAS